MSSFDLLEHLKKEHRITPFSQYLKEIVYGGNDGIVTTFAVVAGFAGAQKDGASMTVPLVSVLLFGLANLFADGVSMSLGSFLSHRADADVYKGQKSKEEYEIQHEPDKEFAETIDILKSKKFSQSDATVLASIYRKNPTYWTEFMMKDELEMTDPDRENASYVAMFTFGSFTLFGAIPLIPYMFQIGTSIFSFSVLFTTLALLLLGMLRGKVSGGNIWRGVAETLLVGGLSATVAFIVGSFF